MSTVKQMLFPGDAEFPTSNGAAPVLTQGTNFPVAGLAFDATTQESVFFKLPLVNYGSGNITLSLRWYADTASSGGITFDASLASITPDADTQDVETKAFATAVQASDTHLGTTGQRLHTFDIAINQLDSAALGDEAWIRLRRVPADAGDTMTGDAIIESIQVAYSDT